jgi:hypothetical protein
MVILDDASFCYSWTTVHVSNLDRTIPCPKGLDCGPARADDGVALRRQNGRGRVGAARKTHSNAPSNGPSSWPRDQLP